MIKKLLGLQIFEDAEGKTNLDLDAVDGELLLCHNLLCMRIAKGNRPSLSKPVIRIWRMNCTNISSAGAAKVFPR